MAGLGGLKVLLLWAGIIVMAKCQTGVTNVSTLLPPSNTTNSTLPSGTSLSVTTSPPHNMTAAPVMSSDTPTTTRKPPLTSPALTSNSPITALYTANMSATTPPPASTSPSPLPTSSKPTDSQTNTTHNQTQPTITTPYTTVTPTTEAPPPPQCSYTVTPIKFGFQIDMIMNSTTGNYIITLKEEDRQSTFIYNFNQRPRVIEHLKPCTEYEHSVAFIDAGKTTPCNGTEDKTKTSGMSPNDIEDGACMPEYVCYKSEWDISSSLSASNNVPAEPCKTDIKTFCIKPGFNDICTDLTTTFRSDCTASINRTKSITVDFLNASEITQKAPTGLPAMIYPELPKNCQNLTVNYTCEEEGKPNNTKKLSELEPFTDYSCTGQIKENNVTKKNTTAVKFRIDCEIKITYRKQSATDTSIELKWDTTSQNCPGVPDLKKFSYDCSCRPSSSYQSTIAKKGRSEGRTCQIDGLESFINYTCKVQPKYDDKNVQQPTEVTQQTAAGIPDAIAHDLQVNVLDHNVIRVKCDYKGRNPKGPKTTFIARLHNAGDTKTLENKTCDFNFKDLSYLTEYNLEVTVYNGKFESKPKKKDGVTTSYNYKALISGLVAFIIFSVAFGVAVYKIYVPRRRKSRNDAMMLEPTAIYANVPRSEGRH